jgi:hypothetical protein
MDDDLLDPKDEKLESLNEEGVDDFDDDLALRDKKQRKMPHDDDLFESLDTLADEEDGPLSEDSYDDEDLW